MKSTLRGGLLGVLFGLSACSSGQAKPDFPPITSPRVDGHYCFKGTDCQSGICEGQGCGPQSPGTCSPKYRICSDVETEVICTCDDVEVKAVTDCPNQRYKSVRRCN